MKRLLAILAFASTARAQSNGNYRFAVDVEGEYRIISNITYVTATGYDAKLDVYESRDTTHGPKPTVVFYHGGGWVNLTKDSHAFAVLPYLAKGWNAVNVDYRLASTALAPAAVEDARCALLWVWRNAKAYNIDTTRIVVSGSSAGGHLALMAGMLPVSEGLDRQCQGKGDPRPAAIVNWYGISDVNDIISGPNEKRYAVAWFGSLTDREAIAKRVSPLTYVRPGLPPTISIQGDADRVVPYTHSLRLRDALNKAGVPNELITVPGGGHGNFSAPERQRAYAAIDAFLARYVK
ncbi:MAG: Esterase/lipase [Gemmatimonadetes bacterium]|nr:Esterase/lipase [Gemmatimonadota bacterium]